jgi:hypothetical protein
MIDTWGRMKNWNKVIPPSRPSEEQLRYFILWGKNLNKTDAVAVLGSTIEFRDILYELGFANIFIIDRNKEFYKQTSKERIYKNKETFIHGDWIDMLENYKSKFRLILSDLTSGNIAYDRRNKFYSAIENSLMIGGHFYDKVLTHDYFLSVDALIKKYEELPINKVTVNNFSCEFLFCSELLCECEMVDSSKIYEQLEKTSNSERINKFLKLSRFITPEGMVWHYGRVWGKLKAAYCPNLKLVKVLDDIPGSPYFDRVKIFHLNKLDK